MRSGMTTLEVTRGRLIDHVQLVVPDLARARRFYEAVLGVLGVPIAGEGPGFFWADELCVSTPESPEASGMLTGRAHLAFQAETREAVAEFHRVGLAAGGSDNGAPGLRRYHPRYFAAFVLDPDGNSIEAVFHGPAQRSSRAVGVRFE